ESISRSSVSIVYVTLKENVVDRGKEFDDIKSRLDGIHDLPQGAGPIEFNKDFGDTAALMLTVSSPPANDIELELRAKSISASIIDIRRNAAVAGPRATLVVAFPPRINEEPLRRAGEQAVAAARVQRPDSDPRLIEGPGFLGIDAATKLDDEAFMAWLLGFARERLQLSELHPDVWRPTVVRDPGETLAKLKAVVGARYSYR